MPVISDRFDELFELFVNASYRGDIDAGDIARGLLDEATESGSEIAMVIARSADSGWAVMGFGVSFKLMSSLGLMVGLVEGPQSLIRKIEGETGRVIRNRPPDGLAGVEATVRIALEYIAERRGGGR